MTTLLLAGPIGAHAQVCKEHPKAPVVRLDKAGISRGGMTVFRVVPVRGGAKGGLAVMTSFRDLNSDHRSDERLFFGELDAQKDWNGYCGNWGHCEQGIYLKCADGHYMEAVAPDHYYGLDVGSYGRSIDKKYWRDIRELVRKGGYPDELWTQTWRWNGKKYQRGPSSKVKAEKPEVDGECPGTGLPAISTDGRRVAVMQCRAGYDDSHEHVLLILNSKTGAVVSKSVLSKSLTDGKGALGEAVQRRRRRAGNRLLAVGKFRPLEALRDLMGGDRIRDARGLGIHLRYDQGSRAYRIKGAFKASGTLRGFPSRGMCCSPDTFDPKVTCTLPPTVTGAWVARKAKLIVFETAAYDGPDGCEEGPAYTVVRGR